MKEEPNVFPFVSNQVQLKLKDHLKFVIFPNIEFWIKGDESEALNTNFI